MWSPTTRSARARAATLGAPTRRPVLVGVAGGSGAGKSTVVRRLVHALGDEHVSVIQHDAYYRDLSHLPLERRVETNFDHPDSLETALLVQHLEALIEGRGVDVPVYDFATHTRLPERRRVAPMPLVILDGILTLAHAELRALMDLGVFVHADADARTERRLRRDLAERGRSAESVLAQLRRTVFPMHDRYVEPSRAFADVTITGGGHNVEAVAGLIDTLRRLIRSRASRSPS